MELPEKTQNSSKYYNENNISEDMNLIFVYIFVYDQEIMIKKSAMKNTLNEKQ